MRKIYLSCFLLLLFCCNGIYAQNLGFEASGTTPANWTLVTGTWNTVSTTVRTGNQSMNIADPATTGSTIGTTTPFVTTTTAGNYLITMGWGRSSSASNSLFHLGYRNGTTNTLNPTTTTSGQAANVNNTGWSRVVSVSSATVPAGTYGVSLRAFNSATAAGTNLFMDDIIMYASTSNVADLTAPNAATSVQIAGANLSWVNGIDNGTPASGIGGVVIIKAPGTITTAPTLNSQAMYAAIAGEAGTNSFVQGGTTWTVVGNINEGSANTFSDPNSSAGTFTYVVFLRDLAYNYSEGAIATTASACSGAPTAGISVVNPSAIQCFSILRTLSLQGATFASGITYQWQTSSTLGGTYADFGVALGSSSLAINPLNTAFYRCKLKCGTDSTYSTPVEVLVNSGLAGNFTINKNLPASTSNFVSFTDAITAVSCGITGPVTFTVVPGSGPYTEQVSIPAINGASSTKRITIKGNNETLTFVPTVSTSRHVLWLNGADFITIDSLNVTSGGSVAGWGIVLTNAADSNRIANCTIDVGNINSTSSFFIPIVINGSNNGTAISGNNGNGNIIEKNTLLSGNFGFYFYGNAASPSNNTGNVFRNNILKDFYGYGISATYVSAGTIISKNDFSRPTRTNSTTTGGVNLSTGCRGVLVEKNRIHNLFDAQPTATSITYGILVSGDAVAGFENKIINNALYAFNGNGTHYGISNGNADYMHAYHNTIVMNDAAATGIAYGLHQTVAAVGLVFKNNIVHITKGGTAAKRCLAFITTTSTILCNNNILYLNAGGGTDNHLAQFGASTSVFTDLTSWKASNSNAYDQASLSLDAGFTDPNNGNLSFSNTSMDGTGEQLGVTQDIADSTRSVTPDPGCYEISFLQTGIDMKADVIVSPAINTNGCYTNAETVIVRIKNNSTNSINFVTNPCTITVNVVGAAAQSINHTVNTGTLASDGILDVTLPSTINLSLNGGYSINAIVAVSGDVNSSNNNLLIPVTRERVSSNITSVIANPSLFCNFGGQLPVLRANGVVGSNSIKWQSSTSSNGTFTDIANAITNPFTLTSSLTQTMYYRALAVCGTQTFTSTEDTVLFSNPEVLTTTPRFTCGAGTVTLSASGSANTTLNWYAAATGGTNLATGNNFTTPSINTTTTYFVGAKSDAISSDVSKLTTETASTGTSLTTYGQDFTLTSPILFNNLQVFSTTGTSITIALYSANGAAQLQTTGAVAVTAGSSPIINLNWSILPGTYRLCIIGMTGNFIRDNSGVTYPFALGSVGTMNGFVTAITGGLATTNAYYFIYKWNVTTSCESVRTPVVATVDNSPGCTPLPVFLLQFGGAKEGAVNKLNFTTANETNNKGFYVERSADGYKFSSIGYIATKAASGSSTNNLMYNFVDEKPLAGTNYYRLKQEDKDGKTTLSNVVAIKGKLVSKIEIEGLYPNPTSHLLTIQLSTPSNQKVDVIITDLQGKLVHQQPVNIASGNNNVQLNLSTLSAGNYLIKAVCNNGCSTTTHKFVKF